MNPNTYRRALSLAQDMIAAADESGGFLEFNSAFKQAGSDCGIPYGDEMTKFVRWANEAVTGQAPAFMAGHPVEMD